MRRTRTVRKLAVRIEAKLIPSRDFPLSKCRRRHVNMDEKISDGRCDELVKAQWRGADWRREIRITVSSTHANREAQTDR